MDFLVKDNKCLHKTIRGTALIDSISAAETKTVTLEFDDEFSAGTVCICNAVDWPLQCEVMSIGNSVDNTGYVVVNVTNPSSQSAFSNATINYIVL